MTVKWGFPFDSEICYINFAPRFHRDWVGFRANKIELGLTLLPAAFLVVNVHRRPDRNAQHDIGTNGRGAR
jgi:hypothetical protein